MRDDHAEWSEAALASLARHAGAAVLRDRGILDAAAEDFGRLIRGTPCAVARPKSSSELERVIAFADSQGLSLSIRGRGYSQGGQSLTRNGVTLDLSEMNRVERMDPARGTVECEGGATWRGVVAKTGAAGFLPCVMPLNLDMTVAGTLSVGGIGATTHRFGPSISNVAELEVVTGGGRSARCGPDEEPSLFHAVLGGLGRCAVISRGVLRLRRIKPRVRTFCLFYDSLDEWLDDQRLLVEERRFDYVEAFCASTVLGLRNGPAGRRPFACWFYVLHVSVEYAPGASPDPRALLGGLSHQRVVHVEDNETVAFADRYQPRFELMRKTGAWESPHPWVECFLGSKAAAGVIPRVLDRVPLFLGDGHRLVFLERSNVPPFFMIPEVEDVVGFAILPTGVPRGLTNEALEELNAVHELLLEAGGKRYLSGWLGMMTDDAWRAHYGPRYEAWVRAKRTFDPNDTLASALFPTSRG